MSITRTAWTDDDGSGTTGTIINNAVKTTLYDELDARWSEYTITSTGTQNNLSITSGGVEADVLRCNNASLLSITGIAAPASPAKPGKRLMVFSVGAGQVDITNQDGNSTAANQIITGSGQPASLAAGVGAALLAYDDTTDRWRLVAHEQGGAVAYSPSLAGVTLGSGGTAVGSYIRRGKRIEWQVVMTLGTGPTVPAGPLTVSLPTTAASTTSPAMTATGVAIDATGPAYYAVRAIPNTTSVVSLTTNGSPFAGLGTTTPFTWAVSDVLIVGGWYFAA